MTQISAAIDAGSVGGKIRFYDGTRPATGGTVTTLGGTVTYQTTSYGTAAAGAITANTPLVDGTGVAAITTTWARILDSDDVFVMDADVATSGADINVNTTTMSIGVNIAVTASVLTAGNA